ncbi:MAG: synthase subcomplex epsilon subunit [Herbinix sp.]|jgi:F-type H+-transporting ATPase subunit epsilon|nr:synthase subcomplex epsilon subunit [Herbinix sp.]
MNSFHLKIVSPDGMFFDGEVMRVSLRTIVGDIAILAGHIPYVTAIGTGECRVFVDNTENSRRAACIGGFINVTKDLVLIAATTFEWAEEIDFDRANNAKTRAESEIASGSTDGHSLELAKIKLARANVRLKVIENNKQ